MLTEHQKLRHALIELGYTGWVLNGTEITWVNEPEVRPTQEQINTMVEQIESILEAKAQEERALKVAAYEKLGLTESEINAIL
jgi:hypothetical protein